MPSIRSSLRPLLVLSSYSLLASLALAACMPPPAAAPCACPAVASDPAAPSGPAPAAAASDGRPGLCASGVGVFDDEGFKGRGASFGPGRHDLQELEAAGIENDSIRSVCIAAGCRVTLYYHAGFEGESLGVSADSPVLPPAFNGGASSLIVACD